MTKLAPMPSGDRKVPRKGGRAPTRAERVAAGMIPVEVWFAPDDGLDKCPAGTPRGTWLRELVQKARRAPR